MDSTEIQRTPGLLLLLLLLVRFCSVCCCAVQPLLLLLCCCFSNFSNLCCSPPHQHAVSTKRQFGKRSSVMLLVADRKRMRRSTAMRSETVGAHTCLANCPTAYCKSGLNAERNNKQPTCVLMYECSSYSGGVSLTTLSFTPPVAHSCVELASSESARCPQCPQSFPAPKPETSLAVCPAPETARPSRAWCVPRSRSRPCVASSTSAHACCCARTGRAHSGSDRRAPP